MIGKKRNSMKNKVFSIIVCMTMLLGILPYNVGQVAADTEEPIATLFFASDYQSSSNGQEATFTALLDSVNNAGRGDDIDTAVFCGDYSTGYGDMSVQCAKVKSLIGTKFGTDVSTVLLQGNHDDFSSTHMAQTGAIEYEDYIVYVINQKDFPWNQGTTSSAKDTVKSTSNALKTYLDGLIANNDKRPVFIATHVPLHMSSRTSSKYNSGDNMYASYLFDVVNEAGTNLDIVLFFGHNHSHGWDSYLGGGSIYKPKGSVLPIPDSSKSISKYTNYYTNETLTFTYMNAGYVGYYTDNTPPADDTLTCTVLDIYGDRIEVNRYDANGLHKLGSQGAYNKTADNGSRDDSNGFPNGTKTAYAVTAADLASPQDIERINSVAETVSMSIKGYSTNVDIGSTDTVTATLRNAEATKYEWTTTDSSVAKLLENNQSVARVEYNKGGTATIKCKITYTDANGNEATLEKEYTVTVKAEVTQETTVKYTKLTSVNDITAGDGYLFIYSGSDHKKIVSQTIETRKGSTSSNREGLVTETVVSAAGNTEIESDAYTNMEWTFEKGENSSEWYIKSLDGKYLYVSESSNYPASLGTSKSTFTFSKGDSSDTFKIYYNDANNMIQFSDKRDLVYGYNTKASTEDFYIYKKTADGNVDPAAVIKDADGTSIDDEYSISTSSKFKASIENISEVVEYSWSVSDKSIASIVDADKAMPTLNFKKEGTVKLKLTLKYKNGSETKTITTEEEINVAAPQLEIVKGTQIITDILQRRYEVNNGDTESLTSLIDIKGTVNSITWASSNTDVAKITGDGENATLTFKGTTGYTYITIKIEGVDEWGEPFTQVSGVTYYTSTDPRSTGTDDYPNYPDNGSIKVDKYAESVDFASTGVAQVKLELDGVAARKALDVVIVLDMSSSMNLNSGAKRYQVMEDSLMPLLDSLLGDNADGTSSEHRVAITAFNNYDYGKITDYQYSNTVNYSVESENSKGYLYDEQLENRKNPIWTGDATQTEGALVGSASLDDLKDIVADNCSSSNCKSGTNYDLGLMTAYNILADARDQERYEREQVVIFMSDGAPFQYNYFRGFSGTNDAGKGIDWMAWLNGDESNSVIRNLLKNNEYAQKYLNPDGKNWWAEAIKASDNNNKVIDPYDSTVANNNYVKYVDGLGATIYSIGFCLEQDAEITLEQEQETLRKVSGSSERTYFADDGESLTNVFSQISNELVPAATETYVKDTVGEAYNIQYANSVTVKGNKIELTDSKYIGEAPYIEVSAVEVDDTRAEINSTRKTVEKITFETNASGELTAAFSDLNPGVNIYKQGKINATYFTLDTETELFEWNIGTVQGTTKYSLSYFVSLNGAAEGTREAGSYATNKAAIASYINYLGNPCSKEFPVPYMAWQAAHVTYEFYLVNEFGQPVNEDGAVVTFANRVTYYTGYHTTKLNSDNTAQAAVLAQEKLPDGFELYNEDTAYFVNIGSGSNVSDAYVSDDQNVQTTFVWRPSGAEYVESSFVYEDKNYNYRVEGLNDYANTYVAFAVKATPELVNRVVTKVWDDEDDKAGKRPDEVYVQLYADGVEVGDVIKLDESNKWTYTWEYLYKYKYSNGVPTTNEINYTIIETPVDDYIPTVTLENGRFTLSNKYKEGVYSLKVLKENDDGEVLPEAGFRLYTDEACLQVAPVYMDEEMTQKQVNAGSEALMTDNNGLIHFYGLSQGVYYIKEFRTPTGYTLLESPLKLEINEDGKAYVTNSTGTYLANVDKYNQISITITNRQLNVDIPFTAGTGIFGLLYAAMFLILVATYLMFRYKKRQRTN